KKRIKTRQRDLVEQHVKHLYPKDDTESITDSIVALSDLNDASHDLSRWHNKWSENDITLITYGDTIKHGDEAPLRTLT